MVFPSEQKKKDLRLVFSPPRPPPGGDISQDAQMGSFTVSFGAALALSGFVYSSWAVKQPGGGDGRGHLPRPGLDQGCSSSLSDRG